MADSSLQERLREHAEAFDGLLSLIPAKLYYGKGDVTDQWMKKKQTKQEALAARRAKLDPDNVKSAKDVMDERVRKRKLEELEDMEDMDDSDIEGVEKELPQQGLRLASAKVNKKPKLTKNEKEGDPLESGAQEQDMAREQKRLLKQEKKKEKEEDKKARQKEKKEIKALNQQKKVTDKHVGPTTENKDVEIEAEDLVETKEADEDEDAFEDIIEPFEGLEDETADQESSAPASPAPSSPPFDSAAQLSSNTSTSSVIPPATAPKHIKIPVDQEALRARLHARIEALRAARKADGPDGKPARNREELLEARRKKEEERKAHKKEVRRLAKIEEEAKREAALASARNSPASSLMSSRVHSPENSFSFGRVAFADGQTLSGDLTQLRSAPKKRGPQDPAAALLAIEKKRERIAGLDEEQQADIAEKDLWLNAKKRAHGEKIRDDASLLKKTLKRKTQMKTKSAKEWSERKEGIAKSQAMKQKKRTENLQKRRDEKGTKGKGSKGKSAKSKKPKVRSRPGFEGSSLGSGKRK